MLRLDSRSLFAFAFGAFALCFTNAASAQNILVNPSFDDNGGSLDGWIAFGNSFADTGISLSPPASGKMFGPFAGPGGVSGIFQQFPADANIEFTMDCSAFVGDFDLIAPGNFAVMKIVFFDDPVAGAEIGANEVIIGNDGTPVNTWTPYTVSATSPAGTQRVQAMFLFIQIDEAASGSVFVDDASFQATVSTVSGACCDNETGACQEEVLQADCVSAGLRYGGDDSTCADLIPACGSCGENLYVNPGFDDNGGSLDGWGFFGGAFPTGDFSQSAPGSAVLFGNFTGGFNVSGILQSFSISEGMEVEMSGSVYVNSGDPLLGDNSVVFKIAYFNAASGGAEIGSNEIVVADSGSATDVWTDYSFTSTAVPGTLRAEGLVLFLQPGTDTGAMFADDMSFQVVCPPEPEACCFNDGSCDQLIPDECAAGGGSSVGGFCEGDGDVDGIDGRCGDGCPNDVNKTSPGICGCGTPDDDSDADGIADCNDQCPGEDDTIDDDNDGTPDCLQNEAVPTVSTWGLLVLALALLIATKLGFRRRVEAS